MGRASNRGQAAIELIFITLLIFSMLTAFVVISKSADQNLKRDRFSSQEKMQWNR